ncbi:MAG: replicative DNA helicase [Actinomycetaceae bacterium]|nr:replicative DNA helicase [Actinomycetaceae bacterium]
MAEGADYDRVPPHDMDAEQSVLGAMLLSKDAIADVTEAIKGSDYYAPKHETIHNAIIDLYGRGEPADAITVAAELEKRGELGKIGGGPYLHTLTAMVPTAANANYYAKIVRDKAQMRALVDVGTRIVQLGYAADGGDPAEIINTAQSEIYAVTQNRMAEDYVAIGEVLDPLVAELEEIENNKGKITGVPTGFYDLDRLLGGLHEGQMIIVAARPAMGKSTLALDFCRSASIKHGIASVIFSLEMSRSEIAMRMLAAEGRVQMSKMRRGEMDRSDWVKVAEALSRADQAPLFIDDSPNMSMTEIRAKCRRLKQQHNLGLVVVDYLQLMTSGRAVESRQQEVSEFSRALKLLAKELELPVIAVAQLNRGPEQRTDHRPMMADLRESGSLEQDADVIMLLHRPEVYNEDDRAGEADIIVAKHRNGSTGVVPVSFLGHLACFGSLGPEA